MIAENKKIGNDIAALSDEAILLLRKLVMMLSPISTTTLMQPRLDITGSNMLDGIGVVTNIAGTIPTITSLSQLGGQGINSSLFEIQLINSIPIDGGFDYKIGDVVLLSGGINGNIIINDIYDSQLSQIDITPINGGSGYISGEVITIQNIYGSGVNGKVRATSVDSSGGIVEVSILEVGYDYMAGNGYHRSTTGSGTGLVINITSVLTGIGPAKSVTVLSPGTNFSVGNYSQLSTTGNGKGIIITVLSVNTGYGNTNFLQKEMSGWLYSDMIRNQII